MLLFLNKKLVLLSVPKTGTTAIEAALERKASMIVSDPPELKHAHVYRYIRFFMPMFEKALHDMPLIRARFFETNSALALCLPKKPPETRCVCL